MVAFNINCNWSFAKSISRRLISGLRLLAVIRRTPLPSQVQHPTGNTPLSMQTSHLVAVVVMP